MISNIEAIDLFSSYLKITGVAHIGPEPRGDPKLIGKRLGLLNGSSWITLWSNYFGRQYLPGVHLVNAGNEAVQISFMQAHEAALPTPPQSNIQAFVRYATDLVTLAQVDAILITCSTMNRSYPYLQAALEGHGIPVVQIDRPMMEKAIQHGGRVLVVATHGPTVRSTQALLEETAAEMKRRVDFSGLEVEDAWQRLAEGDVVGHNQTIAGAIQLHLQRENNIASVVLAQLSMTLFMLSYPDPVSEFGIPVFTSGQCGFEYMRDLLTKS